VPAEALLLDAAVYVSAVRHPERETGTFRLLGRVLRGGDLRLVEDEVLVREYLRYAQVFPSPTAAALAAALAEAMERVAVEERFLLACAPYFRPAQIADCVHAAACLHSGAVLVSNDRHFGPIRKVGIVPVLTATEAVRRWVRVP